MTVHNKKAGNAALAGKPADLRLPLDRGSDAEIAGRNDEPATASLSFDFQSADPEILRALQEACDRNGIEMQSAQARLPSTAGTYQFMALPSDFKGKPN